ncbi:hypothetical protein BDW02DRAFT_256943 [Decorospora gaudefroyi]|uniref:Heterokaryon incompatibility domain-containing protein n=1 Tax=Decorospora gaudefroyi TaxID=184978 RepID=A0A6A5KKD6_9PLEO|nr:hypothetical protein BDW02DRAFT_256943 [Decorospora gaudefroyi]
MDVDIPEGQGQQLTPELLCAAANIGSLMAAISASTVTCELHEHCDGSCSGNGPVEFQPLQVGHHPYRATVKDRIVFDLPLVQHNPTQIPSEDFQYTPIDSASGEIRVLRLHEAVFRSDAVVADLVTINIRDANRPHFGALSYHWGEPVFDQAIVCNGKRLNINASLHACLKRHRSDWLEKPEFLWVDAISINQRDAKELNQQLLLMGDIYRGAQTVFVDFGDAPREWYVGYDLMLRVRVIRKMLNEKVKELVDEELQERVGLPPFSHVSWHNFGVIFTSSWLQRTWTIQEVVLAKNIRCRYGLFNFEWEAMISMSHLMGLQSRQIMRNLLYHQMVGLLNLDRIMRIRLEFQAGRLPPLQLLWRTRDCEVSNPRDKVVGLLGMLLPTLTKAKFEPDYTWPTEELFYHFAKYILRNCNFPDRAALLSFAGLSLRRKPQQDIPEVETALPSWVPDWLGHNSTKAAVFSIIREKPFKASKGTLPIMYALGEYGTDECFITQIGYSLGKITSLGKTEEEVRTGGSKETTIGSSQATKELPTVQDTNSDALRSTDLIWLQWYKDAAQVFQVAVSEEKLGRYEDPKSAFAITLLAGDDYKGDNATPTTNPIDDPSLSLAAVVADISSHHPRLEFGKADPDSLYKNQAFVACRGRRIAVTEQGYIGLVPACSQVGDEVYLLGGVSVPFVLRKKNGNKFVLVGDSYVHGVMEGEVAEMISTNDWAPIFIY